MKLALFPLVTALTFPLAAQQAASVGNPEEPTTVAATQAPQPVLPPQVVAANNPNLTNEQRGDIMMARKMYREAVDFFKIEADDNPVLANKTGMAYHQLGDLKNAKKYYDKAIKKDKTYAEAINNRGTVQYARKSYYQAMKDYQKAIELNPTSATMWMNLGTAFFARKKEDDALQCYIYAYSLDPQIFERRGTSGVQIQERSVEEKAKFYYMLARTYAQAGVAELTMQYVRFALENGFEERERFIEDPEFAFLQEDPTFQILLDTEFEAL